MISYHFSKLGFWIRIPKRGHGITVMWDGWLPFSERYGYHKVFRIGRFRIKHLPPITRDGEVRSNKP